MNDHQQHIDIHEDFYSQGLLEPDVMLLDSRKYGGRGRPRKTDYSPLIEIQKYQNQIISEHIEAHRKFI